MALWHYADGDVLQGPVEAAEIERLIASGAIGAATLVWKEGLPDWQAASRHFTFGTSAPSDLAPPPIPNGAPAADPNIGPDGLYVGAPSREFIEAAKVCLSKYVTFSGRASRSEFWFFYLFYYIVLIVAQVIDFAIIFALVATDVVFFFPVLTILATFGFLLPQLAVSWRRLHDIDRTGWWLGGMMILTTLIYGAIIAFVVGTEGAGTGAEPPEALLGILPIFVLGMIAYAITIFVFYVTKGTLGPNRFG